VQAAIKSKPPKVQTQPHDARNTPARAAFATSKRAARTALGSRHLFVAALVGKARIGTGRILLGETSVPCKVELDTETKTF
jgi:hypothetical protein